MVFQNSIVEDYYVCSTKETFLQDNLEVFRQSDDSL